MRRCDVVYLRPTQPPAQVERIALIAGLIAGVVLAGLVGWLSFRTYEAQNREAQRERFVHAAADVAVNLSTVDYQHADADAQRILDSATGRFADSFARRKQSYIDTAKQTRSRSLGEVTDAGLESVKRRPGSGAGRGDGEVRRSRAGRTGAAVLADADHRAEGWRRRQGLRRRIRVMTQRRSVNWSRVLVYGLLPALALLLAIAAGLLKWKDSSIRDIDIARSESVSAARDSTDAVLTFRYDTVDHDVAATRGRLTGGFLDTYTQRTQQELIPNAKQQRVVAAARVPAAAPESVSPTRAVVLLFVNQTVRIGDATPTDIESNVRVTLDKIGGRWLISDFDQY